LVSIHEEIKMARAKLPMFCPREECKRITGTIDDECLIENGVCKTCYVELVESRAKPLIDVEFYAKRLKERGY
jgi:hypothetical protein